MALGGGDDVEAAGEVVGGVGDADALEGVDGGDGVVGVDGDVVDAGAGAYGDGAD